MQSNECPSCGTAAMVGTIYCDNCGFDLRNRRAEVQSTESKNAVINSQELRISCPNCNYLNPEDAVFCENCGISVISGSGSTPSDFESIPEKNNLLPGYQIPEMKSSTDQDQVGQLDNYAASSADTVESQKPRPFESGQPDRSPGSKDLVVSGRLVNQARKIDISLNLGKPEILIGREDPMSGSFPDINLDSYGAQDDGVSRMHLRISLHDSKLVIEDLDSVNGTILNHQRLIPLQPVLLNHGDEVRLGKMILTYYS